jgi:peptide/nickel transport system substrate-binding protein
VPAFDLNRRQVLQAGVAGTVAMATARRPKAATMPFTVVLESEVVIVDPHMTTAAITRTFGYHIFGTLFSMDSKGRIHPQMVGDYTTSADALSWSFALRDGLKWHDGSDVTASDCVASLQRWGKQDSLGRILLAATNTITAVDPRHFTINLHQPFPLMLDVLGKPNAPVPCMMPARIMQAAAAGRITEIVGSGPFVFQRDQWRQATPWCSVATNPMCHDLNRPTFWPAARSSISIMSCCA